MQKPTHRLLLALIIILALGAGVVARERVNAAPDLAPTSVASIHGAPATGVSYVTLRSGAAPITADAGGPALSLPSYSLIDLSYTIDETLVNTTTLTLQYSNDGANWVNGAAVASAIVADGSNLNQYPNFGRYTRIYMDVSNTNPITITVLDVAKP